METRKQTVISSFGHGILLMVLFLLSVATVHSQKVLQIETRNNPETIKFFEGESLWIKLHDNPRGWQEVYIISIKPDQGLLVLDIGTVKVDEIAAIKTPSQKEFPRALRRKLFQFGAGLIILSPLNLLVDLGYPWAMVTVGGGSIVLGFLSELFLSGILKHRITGRKSLRLLDLTMYAPPNRP